MSVCDATSRKTSSSKGSKQLSLYFGYLMGQQFSSHSYNFTPSHTISSNGSIVFDFSKQLNSPYAKAIDFALVVSLTAGLNR
jgi:hypothetical protein